MPALQSRFPFCALLLLGTVSAEAQQPAARLTATATPVATPRASATAIAAARKTLALGPLQIHQAVSSRFARDNAALKETAERLNAQVKGTAGLPSEQILSLARSLAKERDLARRAELQQKLDAYKPQIERALQGSGLDLAGERAKLLGKLNLKDVALRIPNLTISLQAQPLDKAGQPATSTPIPTPPPTPGPADLDLRPPYSLLNKAGDQWTVAKPEGELSAGPWVAVAGAAEGYASVGDVFHVDPGVRRLSASTVVTASPWQTGATAILGYASAELVVSLQVMQGTRLLCSDQQSIHRSIAVVFGNDFTDGRSSMPLQCSFDRPAPGDPDDLSAVVELHGWAGCGGGCAATTEALGVKVPSIHIHLQR